MKFWLFLVMEDGFPGLWRKLVDKGIAAQHYPPKWPNAPRNIGLLSEIQAGDWLVAAIRGHRFVGFGRVAQPLARVRGSLGMRRGRAEFEFAEQLKVEWHAVPAGAVRPFVLFDQRSARGITTSLHRGACVREINEESFRVIRERLLRAGAALFPGRQVIQGDLKAGRVEMGEEGKKTKRLVNTYERNLALREEAIRLHGVTCMGCGFHFGSAYGKRGDGYIEVHHLKPVSSFSRPTKVNPRTEMTVLCANCHRMVHRSPTQPLSLPMLRGAVRRAMRTRRRSVR